MFSRDLKMLSTGILQVLGLIFLLTLVSMPRTWFLINSCSSEERRAPEARQAHVVTAPVAMPYDDGLLTFFGQCNVFFELPRGCGSDPTGPWPCSGNWSCTSAATFNRINDSVIKYFFGSMCHGYPLALGFSVGKTT